MELKTLWTIAIITILSFNLASSKIIFEELNKDLQAGETFVGKIEINLKDNLKKEDIKIFEDRREVFFEREIFRYRNLTFIYIVFSKAGNFSIRSSNFLYYEDSILKEDLINQSMEIKPATSKVLTLSPGIVANSNLSLFLTNSGSEDLSVEVQENTYELKANNSKRITILPIEDLFYLDIASYKNFIIPVIYFNFSTENNNTEIENETNQSEDNNTELFPFEILVNKIHRNLTINKTFSFEISLTNKLNKTIKLDIKSDLRRISFNKSLELEALEKKEFTFDFISENQGIFEGEILFSFEESSKNVSLLFYVLENEESFEEFFSETNLTCADVGGELCTDKECTYPGNVRILEGICCIGGKCKSYDEIYPPAKKNYFLGILSLAIVGALAYFVYKKFKGVKATPKF